MDPWVRWVGRRECSCGPLLGIIDHGVGQGRVEELEEPRHQLGAVDDGLFVVVGPEPQGTVRRPER